MKFIDLGDTGPQFNIYTVKEGYAGIDDIDTIGFSVNSEAAYTAVMDHFGDHIDHDETSGIMYVPASMWPNVEAVAFDADGVGAEQDDGYEHPESPEQEVAEGDVEHDIASLQKHFDHSVAYDAASHKPAMMQRTSKDGKLKQLVRQPNGNYKSSELAEQDVEEVAAPINAGDKITWFHSTQFPEVEGTVVGKKDGKYIIQAVDPSPRNTAKTVTKYLVSKNNIISQGMAEATQSTVWVVHYDYGPHQSNEVKVKASSEEEACAKVERLAKTHGHNSIMINRASPVEQSVEEGFGDTVKRGVKSVKRGMQGWGRADLPITGTANKPKDIVNRNKSYDDETTSRLSGQEKFSNNYMKSVGPDHSPNKHSPRGLQQRVLDREMKKRGLGEEGMSEGEIERQHGDIKPWAYWSFPERVAKKLYQIHKGQPIDKSAIVQLWKTDGPDRMTKFMLKPDVSAILSYYQQMSEQGPLFKEGVAEVTGPTQRYEMMHQNGKVMKFTAKDDADAKRIAAGHGAKSVIKLKANGASSKLAEQGVAEGWKDKVAGAALAGSMAMGGAPAHAGFAGDLAQSAARGLGYGMVAGAVGPSIFKKKNAADLAFAEQIPDAEAKAKFLKAARYMRDSRDMSIGDAAMIGANAFDEARFKKLKQKLATQYNIQPAVQEGAAEDDLGEANLTQMRDYFNQPDDNTVELDNQYGTPERKQPPQVPHEIQTLINKMYRVGKITPHELDTLRQFQQKTKIDVGLKIKEAGANPYAIGMSQAMKSTGDKPPLKKSTINKAHEIARAVKKGD